MKRDDGLFEWEAEPVPFSNASERNEWAKQFNKRTAEREALKATWRSELSEYVNSEVTSRVAQGNTGDGAFSRLRKIQAFIGILDAAIKSGDTEAAMFHAFDIGRYFGELMAVLESTHVKRGRKVQSGGKKGAEIAHANHSKFARLAKQLCNQIATDNPEWTRNRICGEAAKNPKLKAMREIGSTHRAITDAVKRATTD